MNRHLDIETPAVLGSFASCWARTVQVNLRSLQPNRSGLDLCRTAGGEITTERAPWVLSLPGIARPSELRQDELSCVFRCQTVSVDPLADPGDLQPLCLERRFLGDLDESAH